ncbi:MAG: AAA family ATPase [Muribaculaceae bacterium]
MKLKTLDIENIASFEKASVDFDNGPLGNADIFLINGETGSGKSTLLDAICLALYDNTPRMNAGGRGDKENMPDNITYGNPMRLLRLNTNQGLVRLIFEADGDNWEALWTVRRIRERRRKKDEEPGTKLKREWTLTNLRTRETMTQIREINTAVARLTGLDFGQFCRTTMLSQGEFAAFLKSDVDEKAALLQKITGLDKFEKAGKKIFAITSAKDRIRQAAKERRDALVAQALSGERRAELEAEDAELARRKSEAENLKKRLTEAASWETRRNEIAQKLEKAINIRNDAEKQARSEKYADAIKGIRLFDASAKARSALSFLREAQKRLETEQVRLVSCRHNFRDLTCRLAALENELTKTARTRDAIDAAIESRRPIRSILDNAPMLAGKLNSVADLRSAVAASERNLKTADEEIANVIRPRLQHAEAVEKECSSTLVNIRKKLEETSEKLAETKLSDMRKEKDALSESSRKLDRLSAIVDAVKRSNENLAACGRVMDDIAARTATSQKALAETGKTLIAARAARDAYKKSSDDAARAAGDAAEHLRANLRVGDSCPVCGSLIDHELTAGEILRELADKARLEFERHQSEYETALRHQAEIESTIKALAVDKEKTDNELGRLNEEKKRLSDDLSVKSHELGITVDSNLADTISHHTATVADRIGELSSQIAAAETLEKTVGELRASVDNIQRRLDSARKSCEKVRQILSGALERRSAISATIETNNVNIASTLDELSAVLDGSAVSSRDFRREPAEYAADITAAARELTSLIEQSTGLSKQLETLTGIIDRSRHLRDEISGKLGIPEDEHAATAQVNGDSRNVEKDFYSLSNAVTSAVASINAQNTELSRQKTLLDDFFATNPTIDRAEVEHLMALPESTVKDWRDTVDKIQRLLIASETELSAVKRESQEHAKTRPADLIDEAADNTDGNGWHAADLHPLIAEAEKTEREAMEERARIKAVFDNAARYSAELIRADEELSAAGADYSRWEQLCRYLGDAEGKKFRRVAQSHLLECLINGANSYLKRLNDRYELEVYPGTFTIMVTDSYQDYARRTANTISGGETFLVSLALALAMSDIGEMRGCDTLFIDEGFGSLSGEPLDRAIGTLKSLHHQVGRRIGIISHIASLREKIATQIIVERPTGRAASLRLLC